MNVYHRAKALLQNKRAVVDCATYLTCPNQVSIPPQTKPLLLLDNMEIATTTQIEVLNPVPVVFKVNKLDPDTHLQVFQQPFHVHSSALKLHSAFFRTFLDSADKENGDGGNGRNGFRYN
ncbi:hypothetical protein DL98DRAFT_593274 [Cadophora sp. DSE1049]|nr:hypothetical protein DL98DRAFT_593274 [Cadophora sp. DSE1049]